MGIVKKGQNLFRIDAHVLRSGKETRRRELFTGTRAQAEERYLQLKKELREGVPAPCSFSYLAYYQVFSALILDNLLNRSI